MPFLPSTPRLRKDPPPAQDRGDLFIGADIAHEPELENQHGERAVSASRGDVYDPRPRDEEVTARETMTVRMGNTRPITEQTIAPVQAGNVHANVLRPMKGAYVAPQDSPPVPLAGWARIRRNYPTQSWDSGAEVGP